MELQDTFYWMGIIYMGIMFLIMIAGLAIIFTIKRKVDRLHHSLEEKLAVITSLVHMGEGIATKAKNTFKKRSS